MTIALDIEGEIAVLRIDHGPANTLDTQSCRELVRRLEDAEAARAVVLTGTGDIFSAGVDLKKIRDGGPAYVSEFLPELSDALLAVFGFPRPVIAALNGPAIAGGAVLAAACDHRVMADGPGAIGVTELFVGLPFPLAAVEILRCAYGTPTLPWLTYGARIHLGAEALSRGLVDKLTPPDETEYWALHAARLYTELPAEAFAHTKAQIRQPFHERIAEYRHSDDPRVEHLWRSPAAQRSVKAFVERVLSRRERPTPPAP